MHRSCLCFRMCFFGVGDASHTEMRLGRRAAAKGESQSMGENGGRRGNQEKEKKMICEKRHWSPRQTRRECRLRGSQCEWNPNAHTDRQGIISISSCFLSLIRNNRKHLLPRPTTPSSGPDSPFLQTVSDAPSFCGGDRRSTLRSSVRPQEINKEGDSMGRIECGIQCRTDLFSIKNLSPAISLQDPFSLISLSLILIGSGTPFWNQWPAHSDGNLHGSVSREKRGDHELGCLLLRLYNQTGKLNGSISDEDRHLNHYRPSD